MRILYVSIRSPLSLLCCNGCDPSAFSLCSYGILLKPWTHQFAPLDVFGAPGEFHHPGLGLGLRFRVTVRVRVSVEVRVNVIDRVRVRVRFRVRDRDRVRDQGGEILRERRRIQRFLLIQSKPKHVFRCCARGVRCGFS